MALSAHKFKPMNAFCLDFEKPSVDRNVLQMSVFAINVLTCNLCSFYTDVILLLCLDHLMLVSPSLRIKLQRESVAIVHVLSIALTPASLPLNACISLYSPFSSLSALRKHKNKVISVSAVALNFF